MRTVRSGLSAIIGVHRRYSAFERVIRAAVRPRSDGGMRDLTFVTGTLPASVTASVVEALRDAPTVEIRVDDHRPGYFFNSQVDVMASQLNATHRYLALGPAHVAALRMVTNELAAPVAAALGSPWRVVNSRAWRTPVSALAGLGPDEWHTDGLPNQVAKVMVYTNPPGPEFGTTSLRISSDDIVDVEGEAGTWLLFANSAIEHRAVRGLGGERLIIELTIVPSTRFHLEPTQAGLNASYPHDPFVHAARGVRDVAISGLKRVKARVAVMVRKAMGAYAPVGTVDAVNVGGGPQFHQWHWRNLDATLPSGSKGHIVLSPTCSFPLGDRSVAIAYTSHALEHLDDGTVARVLDESRRVLRTDGHLVVKIPDFDRALEGWRRGDASFLTDDRWNYPIAARTWARNGVTDDIDARAAMLFVGVWNDEYGDLFTDRVDLEHPRAYHGPPPVDGQRLREAVGDWGAHEVAARLRATLPDRPWHYNHRNAWGVEELVQLVERHGFAVESTEADDILARLGARIPTLDVMREQSTYLLARPAT